MIVECDICAFARKDFAKRCADPARAAGNERALSFKQKTQVGFYLQKSPLSIAEAGKGMTNTQD